MSASRILRRVARVVQPLMPRSDRGVVVLGYHLVQGGTGSPVDVSAADLRRQLEEIRAHARVATLSEALELLVAGDECAGPVVVVTFDDAFGNFAERAWPTLAELGMPATLYVPVDFVDGRGPAPLAGAGDLPPCSWNQLQEMVDSGLIRVGSHTCSHRNLTSLSLEEVERELRESRDRLEQALQTTVSSFCYPRGKWSPTVEGVVRRTYSSAAVGGGCRLHHGSFSPYRLTRFPIRRDMPAGMSSILRQSTLLEEWLADAFRRRAA